MGFTITKVDCSVKDANYSIDRPYIIPRFNIWMTYRNTCIGFMLRIGYMSYQLYWHLPNFIRKFTEVKDETR